MLLRNYSLIECGLCTGIVRMSSEVKGLLSNSNGASVAVTGGGPSGDESSGSNYGTVLQDSMVMCPVPSDSSDTESSSPADELNRRRLVRSSRSTHASDDTSSPHRTTCVLFL